MNDSLLSPARTHVLLADDHPLVIEGIKMLLRQEHDIRVVAQATTGAEALRCLHSHPEVSVAIVDLNMPNMSGVELTRQIHRQRPDVRVLALSMFYDHASVTEVLEAGGAGYLLKNTSKAELSEAIRVVAAGNTFFSPEVGAMLLQNMQASAKKRATAAAGQPVELTSREKEVLQLVAREFSNAHIAEQLFISERTVETHRRNILAKTNCKSVVGLIQYALRHRLIS
ncbi:response regulator transcription factor [Hymenobacter yonginensis]|uniref:Response regulator transcription factor n=1 Tax=Hymenobacter yonginensis TaxID=748197 RepID=A0ABY7PPL3_9BACT|nr:response regulator transcription factor [Hymenobacter yonginensis]WBO85206.1 response regulator transcription factor [Hymenobacter yonginensis]